MFSNKPALSTTFDKPTLEILFAQLNLPSLSPLVDLIEDKSVKSELTDLLARLNDYNKKFNTYLQLPSQMFTQNLYLDLIKQALGDLAALEARIKRECNNDQDRSVGKAIIVKLASDYQNLRECLLASIKLITSSKLAAQAAIHQAQLGVLREQQSALCTDLPLKEKFTDLLKKIATYCKGKWIAPQGCFISYAWSTPDRENENWIQPFLANLHEHLYQAGITTAKLDIISNPKANNIYDFMQAAEKDDYVLMIGSESLLDKHKQGTSAVCNELILINRKRRADASEKVYRVLPILLSGSLDSAFPPYMELYATVNDWPQKPYAQQVKELLAWLYGGIGDKVEAYEQLWQDFFKSLTAQECLFMKKTISASTSSTPTLPTSNPDASTSSSSTPVLHP